MIEILLISCRQYTLLKKSYLLIYTFNYSKLIIIFKNTAGNMAIFNL